MKRIELYDCSLSKDKLKVEFRVRCEGIERGSKSIGENGGWKFRSVDFPECRQPALLYVLGIREHKDNALCYCPVDQWKSLVEAVDAFNEAHKEPECPVERPCGNPKCAIAEELRRTIQILQDRIG